MGHLFTNGADPTVKSYYKTPKDITIDHQFKLGTVLLGKDFLSLHIIIGRLCCMFHVHLEILECIWNATIHLDRRSSHGNPALHKQLLDW